MIIIYSSNNEIPNGYLLCDGSEISRSTYNKLFNIIGITYGEGNNSTTFNLPDLTNRFIEGNETTGIEKEAGLPNITGKFNNTNGNGEPIYYSSSGIANGAFRVTDTASARRAFIQSTNTLTAGLMSFDASRISSVYGASNTVQPPALTMKYLIKAY